VSHSSSSWLQQIPRWVWWSFFPGLGGLGITYAGIKASSNNWLGLGLGLTGIALIGITSMMGIISLPLDSFITISVYLIQVIAAFILRKPFLIRTYPKHLPIPNEPEIARQIAATRPKVDINACSKNDLVNTLGLPIVYANDIESLQSEGYIFTHLEELSEILDIPQSTLDRIAPFVVFSYDYRKESSFSWRRLNTLSSAELIDCGLKPNIATAIIAERENRGEFRSLIEVKKRTGIPLSLYRHLI
jgi:DNA uptake protein ComE-like DNA-binding protein